MAMLLWLAADNLVRLQKWGCLLGCSIQPRPNTQKRAVEAEVAGVSERYAGAVACLSW
jgi:hypothetical protein